VSISYKKIELKDRGGKIGRRGGGYKGDCRFTFYSEKSL